MLYGADVTEAGLTDCEPLVVTDAGVTIPCGLVAWSNFNDTFQVSPKGVFQLR